MFQVLGRNYNNVRGLTLIKVLFSQQYDTSQRGYKRITYRRWSDPNTGPHTLPPLWDRDGSNQDTPGPTLPPLRPTEDYNSRVLNVTSLHDSNPLNWSRTGLQIDTQSRVVPVLVSGETTRDSRWNNQRTPSRL